jgi:hypothetical protein
MTKLQMALPIFERGHLALVGEWLAWPVFTDLDQIPRVSEAL